MAKESDNLQHTLKPFYQRASEAEDRLSRLEAALASKKDGGNEEYLRTISELQSQLEDANTQLVSEQEKGEKLAVENAKLQYRIIHLVRALREADIKLESMRGHDSEATEETISKLEDLRV